ncbi:MAG TPA: glycosyltransferase family 39 protein [Candidatus Dormibacteraeota bacterium]|nr:glycosyltransferase family 39 protein [Candidatus Dormibacteraeota bacterium]
MRSGISPDEKTRDILFALLAGLLLILMAVLAGGSALRESATVDEVSHIGAGVSYLQKLDLRMNPEHPPLPKVLAAIPLVLHGVRADYSHISWKFSEKFFPAFVGQWVFGERLLEKWNDPKTLLAWARFPMLLLTLALGWAVYACAKRLGGAWGGVLCLTVYVSTPAFLAFGPLVHTDVAVTLFSLLSLWTFAELWQEPNRKSALLFGLSLAGALLSKFTAGVLFVAFVPIALSLRWRAVSGQPTNKPELRAWRRARWQATFKGVLYAALVVYAFYFIFSLHQPTNALYRIGDGPLALFLRRLLFPPFLYLRGLFLVLISSRRPTFLLGHYYSHGVWFYFPIVFVLKSSLAYLSLLFLTGVAASITKMTRKVTEKVRGETSVTLIPPERALHWRVLWVSLLVFTGVCLISPLSISIRHFTVPMVLLILMLAPLPRLVEELGARTPLAGRLGTAAVAALAASCLFTAVRAYPYYFPFINSLSLGRPAYTLVNDSNVDWNQSLPEVRRFAEQHHLQQIGLDDYGFSDPTVFAPQAQPWNCQKPAPGDEGQWVALSANNILDGHNCAWLMRYPHEPFAGGSIYAVQLPAQIPAAGSAGGPPMPSDYRQFGGAPMDIRGFFKHVIQDPDDLPRAVEWMQTEFTSLSKSPGPPPKPPWEP